MRVSIFRDIAFSGWMFCVLPCDILLALWRASVPFLWGNGEICRFRVQLAVPVCDSVVNEDFLDVLFVEACDAADQRTSFE